MDNAINDLLDAIIPQLGALLKDVRFFLGFAMVLIPVLMFAFGAFYLFAAPGEANHKAGYRTYFGMGSVAAWRFTQNFAGKVFGAAGILLSVAAIVGCILLAGKEPAQAVQPGLVLLVIQAVLVIAAFLTVEITVFSRFDRDGNLRKKK